jgi:hypothetical protein
MSVSVSVSSVTTSFQTGFDHLRERLTGSVGIRATAGSYATAVTDPGDSYEKGGLMADPIGCVGAAYATKATVTSVSTAFAGSGDAVTAAVGQAGKFKAGFAAVRAGAAANIGIGAAFGAGLSFVGNAVGLISGKLSPGQAAGRLVTDTVGAGLSATGSVLIGGAATAALGAVGVVGLPLTVAGIGISMLAGWAVDTVYRRSHAASGIYGAVSGALGG